MAVEIATAYISLVPSTKGLGKKIAGEVESAGGDAAKAGEGLGSRLMGGVSEAVKKGALVLGAAGVAAGAFGLKAAADFQQTRIAFEGMLGSADKAQGFLSDLRTFAAKTPFEFPGLANAARQLLGVGFATEDVIPTMTKLGNVAAALGVGEDAINSTVRALGQMKGKGKASAEELQQISEAIPGFSAVGAIADDMGISVAEAFKLMEKGAIPADQAITSILNGMEKFPGAAGAMDRQSKTLNGVISTLKDTFQSALIDGIEPFLPAIAGGVEKLGPLIGTTLNEGIGGLKSFVASFRAADGEITSSGFPGFMERAGFVASQLVDKLKGLPDAFGPIVDAVVKSGLIQGLRDAGVALGGALLDAAQTLGPKLAELAPVIAAVAAGIGEKLTSAIQALAPVVPVVAEFVGKLIDLIQKVPPGVLEALAVAIGGPLVAAKGYAAAASGVGKLGDAFNKLTGPTQTAAKNLAGFFKAGEDGYSGLDKLRLNLGLAAEKVNGIASSFKDGVVQLAAWGKASLVSAANTIRSTAALVAQKTAALASAAAAKIMAAAQWLVNAAMAANPILLVVAAIAALAAGFYLAYQNVGWFRDIVDAVWGFLRDTTVAVFDTVKGAIETAFNWVKDHWPLLLGILTGPIGLAVVAIVTHWDTIKNGFTAVKDWIGDRLRDIAGFFTNTFDGARDKVSTVVEAIVGFFRDLPGRLLGFTKDLANAGLEMGKAILQGLVDAIGAGAQFAQDIAKAVGGALHDFIDDKILGALRSGLLTMAHGLAGVNIPGIGRGFDAASRTIEGIVSHLHLPKLGGGGVITEPTLALLGETSRARPEIVAPERKLRAIMRDELGRGGQRVYQLTTNVAPTTDVVGQFRKMELLDGLLA